MRLELELLQDEDGCWIGRVAEVPEISVKGATREMVTRLLVMAVMEYRANGCNEAKRWLEPLA